MFKKIISLAAPRIFQQWIYIDPKRDLVVATLTNAAQAAEDEDHKHVAAVMQAVRHALDKALVLRARRTDGGVNFRTAIFHQ